MSFFDETETSLGTDLNLIVGLPEDFTFIKETDEPPCRSTYVTPKPAARSTAKWHRDFAHWRTQWSLVLKMQPCGMYEHRLRDLPANEPTFLSYQLPWQAEESRRFYHRLPASTIKAACKEKGRLADPGYFPWELRRVCSPHEVAEQRERVTHSELFVQGWEAGDESSIYRVPVWSDYESDQ